MAFNNAAVANPSIRPHVKGTTQVGEARVPPDLTPVRLSVGQYHAMMRKGILKSGDPVELLEGWLVRKMTKNPPHTTATRLVVKALDKIMPEGWFTDTQEPITLSDSEPETDAMVVRGDLRDYQRRHPGPKEIALIVEVADATLQRERGTKKRVYARAEIPIYWLINLIENQIEVYTQPKRARDPDYQQTQIYTVGDKVPVIIDGYEIATVSVQDLLP